MTTAPITIRHFASFEAARAATGDLLSRDMETGPFDRLDWFEMLHASAFPNDEPMIALATQRDAACWMILVDTGDDGLASLANWYSFWHRPQFSQGQDAATRARLLTAIARDLRQRTSRLVLHPLVDTEGDTIGQMTRALRLAGWSVIPRIMGYKRHIALPAGTRFADYWAGRPGSLRSTFARKTQRMPLITAMYERVTDALWHDLESIFAQSWKPHGDDFAFLRRFAEREADAGRLRLGFALRGSQPLAVELWTVEGGTAFIHKLAFDERAADISPGTQLSYAMFAQAIDTDKVRAIDFGTGDNAYKANWIDAARPVIELDAFDLRRPETWRSALTTGISALRPARLGEGAGRNARREALERMRIVAGKQ